MVAAPGPANSGPCVVAAEERGCDVHDVAVDETGAVERGGNGGSAFDHRLHDALAPELVEH